MNEHHSKMESRKTIQSAVPRRLLSVLLLLTVGLAVPHACAQQDKAGSDKTATQKPHRRIRLPDASRLLSLPRNRLAQHGQATLAC